MAEENDALRASRDRLRVNVVLLPGYARRLANTYLPDELRKAVEAAIAVFERDWDWAQSRIDRAEAAAAKRAALLDADVPVTEGKCARSVRHGRLLHPCDRPAKWRRGDELLCGVHRRAR